MNFRYGKIILWVLIFGIWSPGYFWLAVGLVLFRNPADSLLISIIQSFRSEHVMLSWAGAEVAECRAWCCLCLGRGRGVEGREVAVLHNSTFQFLNAGHSLTEISSRRLSLANYCLAYPSLALLARSGQSYSIHREKQMQNRLLLQPTCVVSGKWVRFGWYAEIWNNEWVIPVVWV